MEVLEIFTIRSDKHVTHEESMIGTGADDPDLDPVLLIPSCEAVYNVDTISSVEIVDGTFTVDSPDLMAKLLANCRNSW